MASAPLYNMAGKKQGMVELEPKIFGVVVKPIVVQQAVRTQQANRRVAIAHTKTRSEVRGGGKKPWRQKGTGRARHGSIRSPIWKGGGITFGPRKNRNFELKMNKKARRQALFMTLSDKAEQKHIIVLDDLKLSAIKTKELVALLGRLPVKKTVLAVLPTSDQNVIKSARNVPFVKVINADSLNVMDVLSHEYILCPQKSLAVMTKTYLK